MAEALQPAIPDEVERLAQAVLDAACAGDLRLATAESCTGGLLASLLTDIPGKSHAFERGFVTYTDAAKHEMLGVPLRLLETEGAVSEAVARAMAEGSLQASTASLSVAVTGFTDGAPEGCEGLVHFACARRGGATRVVARRFGDAGRAAVRLAALEVALKLLHDELGADARAA
jgi:nicotinamide-nucleotide amidase